MVKLQGEFRSFTKDKKIGAKGATSDALEVFIDKVGLAVFVFGDIDAVLDMPELKSGARCTLELEPFIGQYGKLSFKVVTVIPG